MPGRSRRVLVVEDDEVIRTLVADLLADEGYEVRTAPEGAAALAVLNEWRPDLILLDLMMPGMDGWAFRERQRRLNGAASIPVVVLSARHDVQVEDPSFGAVAFIAKPFDVDHLLTTVAAAIA